MKKLLAVALCLAMLLSSLAVFTSAYEIIDDDTFIIGDANGDKAIDAKDLLSIRANIASVEGYTCDGNAADIDADGIVSSKDAFYIKGSFVGSVDLSVFDDSEYQTQHFRIAGRDISEYTVSLPENADSSQNVHYAAEELRTYVQRATGVRLKFVYGEVSGPAIVFHAVDYNSELGQKLGIEGYIYEVVDGNLNIYGTYRGNMYAVYEIVEDRLGFRFPSDDYGYLYKKRVVDLVEGTYQFVYPEIPCRFCRATFGNDKQHMFPLRLNFTGGGGGENSLRIGTRTGPQFINAHSFGYFYRMGTGTMPDESFGTLEERYAEKYNSGIQQDEYSWQPCASSEKEYQILFSGMLDTIARIINWGSYDFSAERLALNINSMGFSGCDNSNFCNCRYCSAKCTGNTISANTTVTDKILPYYTGQYELNGSKVTFHKEYDSGVYIDFANRACKDIQEYYPGLRVHAILYDHYIPETILPHEKLNVWYCGTGCNNHWLGSGECSEEGGQLKYEDGTGMSNRLDDLALKAWGEKCKQTGAQLWFWYYPVTYHYYLCGCPNIFNIYYDYKYLVEECGCQCLFFEGGGKTYNFEILKGYVAAKMSWEPHMSFEQFVAYIKEFLYMHYGEGFEEIYEYLVMQDEAGNECGTCFINNYDRPGDMYSLEYIAEHYEEMRALLETALNKATRSECKERIRTMMYCFDFLGLSAVYNEWYVNGTAAQKEHYTERYTNMFNYFHEINITIFSDSSIYSLPSEMDFTQSPMTQFYEDGSRRPENAWG